MAPQIKLYVGWLMLLLIVPGQSVQGDIEGEGEGEGEGINGVLTGEFREL